MEVSGSSYLQYHKIYVIYYVINQQCSHQYLQIPDIPKASLSGLNSIQKEAKENWP